MSDREMLLKLIEAGEKMRKAMKDYYAHPGGGASQKIKKQLLIASKQAEREFDIAIFSIKLLIKLLIKNEIPDALDSLNAFKEAVKKSGL